MRIIKISFIITTSEIPIDVLAARIGIYPFSSMTTFPKNSIARPCWWIEVVSDAPCIEKPLRELISMLEPREYEIKRLADEISLPPTLQIIVNSDFADRPEITFSPAVLSFFSQIGSEICIEVNDM